MLSDSRSGVIAVNWVQTRPQGVTVLNSNGERWKKNTELTSKRFNYIITAFVSRYIVCRFIRFPFFENNGHEMLIKDKQNFVYKLLIQQSIYYISVYVFMYV